MGAAQLGVVLGAFMLPGIAVTVPAGGASHGSGSPGLNAVLNAVLNAPC